MLQMHAAVVLELVSSPRRENPGGSCLVAGWSGLGQPHGWCCRRAGAPGWAVGAGAESAGEQYSTGGEAVGFLVPQIQCFGWDFP